MNKNNLKIQNIYDVISFSKTLIIATSKENVIIYLISTYLIGIVRKQCPGRVLQNYLIEFLKTFITQLTHF